MNDLKSAIRQLLKSSGFAGIAIAVTPIGIGANTTIFSIINAILVEPINVSEPEPAGLFSARAPRGEHRSLCGAA